MQLQSYRAVLTANPFDSDLEHRATTRGHAALSSQDMTETRICRRQAHKDPDHFYCCMNEAWQTSDSALTRIGRASDMPEQTSIFCASCLDATRYRSLGHLPNLSWLLRAILETLSGTHMVAPSHGVLSPVS
jgi:hypothetical protein